MTGNPKQWVARLLVISAICFAPFAASACEPILPLAQLLSAGTLFGPMAFATPLLMLAVAVTIKCTSFIVLERRLSWGRAFAFMLIANILSTIPGMLVSLCAALPIGVLFSLPVVFWMGNIVKRRLPLLLGRTTVPGVSGGGAVLLFTAFYVLSLFMFGMADHALAGRDYLGYWLWKLLFVCAATTTGILISAVLEEWAVAKLAKRKVGDLSFYPSVLRANYITLGVVLLVATLQILPKRLHSPHFLASLFHSFFAACGLS